MYCRPPRRRLRNFGQDGRERPGPTGKQGLPGRSFNRQTEAGGRTLKLSTLKKIFSALEKAGVRYLVAGGVAVVVHGHPRMTMDLDLVVQLKNHNINTAFKALGGLGYKPSVPISPVDFADAVKRESWVKEKGMRVLNLFSDLYPETQLDIFVTEPFDFDREYEKALHAELEPGLIVRIISIPTLISMKKQAGRNLDHEDVRQLEQILRKNGNG